MGKIRMGLVGGGAGSFIGAVHRTAAELDGVIELVCGAFSSDPERSRSSGVDLYGLPPERCYPSFAEMYRAEQALPSAQRMHFVAIATPNHVHFEAAKAALDSGFHVMCDKPVTLNLAQALELGKCIDETGLLFGLTHNYTGYPMVREARSLIESGALGPVRRVIAEYVQGWLFEAIEGENKQADWRTDPARAGAAGCFGDIGTHAENLVEYITGLQIESLCADLTTFVDGRSLEDDGNVLLRFRGGARGVLFASQVAVGEENGLRVRIYGERGGLEWSQMEPNSLIVRWPDKPYEVRRTGGPGVSEVAMAAARLPSGHPEGYLEAFANLYKEFAAAIEARASGHVSPSHTVPGIADGVRGMRFIEAVVASSAAGGVWRGLG